MVQRRVVYRRSKRLLLGLVSRQWRGTRIDLEPAVRRFLRGRPAAYLRRLCGDGALAAAACAAVLATASAGAMPPIELSDVAAGNGGFVVNGIDAGDWSGFSVSGAGDVNGDGLADVIVGAVNPYTADAGRSYVVFGKADGTAVDLADVMGGNGGFVINGSGAGDWLGCSVSGTGDVNGDGLADVIVGAFGAGDSYVIFGKADATAVDVSDIAAGQGGFVLNGDAGTPSGRSVAGAGDVNGDGLADIIVGGDIGPPAFVGRSYVVFGKADGAAVNLSSVAAGAGGFVMIGIDTDEYTGWSVSGAGDVNGDGLADVIVGANSSDLDGRSYVVFGKADGSAVNLSDVVAGDGGFVIQAIEPHGRSGFSVSGAGDVNADGLADVIVGGCPYLFLAVEPCESYVVLGKATGTPVSLTDVAVGFGGFAIRGIEIDDYAGNHVSGAGDVNGDGLADVIVGGHAADPGGVVDAGQSYVVFGKAYGAAVELADVVAGVGGFSMSGVDAGDGSGFAVSGAGDVNADGLDDVIVGAHHADDDAGRSYVVFSPVVRADLDGDGIVGINDFLALLAAWGPCAAPCPPACAADLDADCTVGIQDFLMLLASWS